MYVIAQHPVPSTIYSLPVREHQRVTGLCSALTCAAMNGLMVCSRQYTGLTHGTRVHFVQTFGESAAKPDNNNKEASCIEGLANRLGRERDRQQLRREIKEDVGDENRRWSEEARDVASRGKKSGLMYLFPELFDLKLTCCTSKETPLRPRTGFSSSAASSAVTLK
ncbi:hypothetical protein EYF80_029011 [Liparis tanakae]|uniref:Uncharacterized protein n=1 Tax=Liparis tanakae TaxID=230148 RepID=A0A4Z2H4H6_9TELE|nr:hypothetical protein EYF80_029011 [Liparis tanakae]